MEQNLETTFWGLALVGTTIFVLKMGMMLVGIGDDLDDGADASFDSDGGLGDDHHSTGSFTVLSIQSLSTFFMGAGWMGLVALKTWGMSPAASSALAVLFGAFLLVLLAKLLTMAFGLESQGNLVPSLAVGKSARVQSRIAEGGTGEIQLELQGRLVTLRARAYSGGLETGSSVKVVSADESGLLVVQAGDA